MSKITAQEITQIADNLVSIARVLGDYIIQHQLSVKGKLGNLHAAILDEANKLYLLSALEIGKEVRRAIEELNDLTTEIQETFEKLTELRLVVNLATSVLNVSTAIAGGDLKGFVQSVKDLKSLLHPEEE
jgi:S-methylmethionine-dependent homocysteine/selenocysteine methylase